jgi:hypothetical protein
MVIICTSHFKNRNSVYCIFSSVLFYVQTAIISLKSVNILMLVMMTVCLFEVWTEFLIIILMISASKSH